MNEFDVWGHDSEPLESEYHTLTQHKSMHVVQPTEHAGKYRVVDSETDDEDEVWGPSGDDRPDHDRDGKTVC